MSITFMAKPNTARGQLLPHPPVAARYRRQHRSWPATAPHGLSELGEHFLAGQLAALRELTLFYAPNINSYKRYVPGSFAPTAVRWGVDNRTCALPARRARPLAARGEPDARRRRQPLPGGRRHDRRRAARHRQRAAAGAGLRRQRLRRHRAEGAAHAARRGWSCGSTASSPARPSATRWSSTTPTTPGSSWPPSTRPSPTGSCAAASSACKDLTATADDRIHRDQPGDRAAGRQSTGHSAERDRRGRRPRRCRAAGLAHGRARRPGPAAAPVRRRRSTPTSSELAALEVTRLRPHDRHRAAGRPATSATCWTTTRPHRSG